MIRFQRPQLPSVEATLRYYRRAEETRWYSNFGTCHEAFAARLADRLGPPVHVVPVANCTLGLMLALRALTAGRPGREVVLPSFTFAATATAVTWAGLEPVFVDVAEGHWSMDPDALTAALDARGDRVAAVLACTTFGAPPPTAVTRAWESAAAAADVPLVLDSAAAFGALDADGLPTGRGGDIEVFSLHATKPFAIGEGGLMCTGDADLAARLRRLTNFGFEDGDVVEPGLNAKLAEWPAAVGLAVLDRFDDILAARRHSARIVRSALAESAIAFQELDSTPAWQFVPALCAQASERDAIVDRAAELGVEVRAYFSRPLHAMTAFAGAPVVGGLDVTDDLAGRALSLPMANDLTAEECAGIARAVDAAQDLPPRRA